MRCLKAPKPTPKARPRWLALKTETRKSDSVRCYVLILVAAGLVGIGAAMIGEGSLAQTATAPQAERLPAPNPDPPGTIDGAKNPELIPDDNAWRMVFLGIAEPENATDEQKARAQAKIARIALSEEDAEAFLRLLAQFQTKLDSLTAQILEIDKRSPILHPLSTDADKMGEIMKQTHQLYADTIAALPAKLSPEGLGKLRAYMQETKRTMKVIPHPRTPVRPTN